MKGFSYLFITLAGVLCSAPLSGCSDDFLSHDSVSDSGMAFSVSVSAPAGRLSRSAAAAADRTPVRMSISAEDDSLFLHPVISDFDSEAGAELSRGTLVGSKDELYKSFMVSAYKYDDTWDAAHAAQSPNYFVSETAVRSGSVYVMSPVRYWPSDGKMRFVAHAPADDGAFAFYPQDDAGRGARVHISIAPDVKDQNDLVVSYSDEVTCSGSSHSPAAMNFKHALTGIRFVCDKSVPEGVITNISFSGVRYEGDLFYMMGDASQSSSASLSLDSCFNAWELYDRTFSLPLNYQITGEDNAQITDGDNTFMMLPQTLPAGASVAITIEHPGAATDTVRGSLEGRVWPAGKIVTYKISTSGQVLDVEEPAVFDYLGYRYDAETGKMVSGNSLSVSSYAGNKNIEWKVEFQDEGSTDWSTTSSWLSVDPSWAWTDSAQQQVPFVAKSSYNSVDIDSNLKKAAQLGSASSPYNLSSATGASSVENTANSYIVSAPGYYILPLVYGNAIKDSAVNSASYAPAASGADALSNFKNHLGASITAPYIADNAGCSPVSAGIVWQDAQNLVSNVSYVASAFGGKGGISFYVSPSSIAQGNAVISISDADSVMWSWHIWVTSFEGFDSSVTVTNQDSQSFTIMPLNLGWCSAGESLRYYPRRECKVRFTPLTGDESLAQTVTFVQESHTSVPFGNNPYYQWGRKDPFVGTNIAWGNKERWDGSGKYYGPYADSNPPRLFSDLVEDSTSVRLTTKQCLDLLIKNPDKWHNPPAKVGGSSYVSLNETYSNLWGENLLSDTKTVYDPCPPGYQVNYFYTYTGFLAKDYNWAGDTGINFVDNTASDWDSANLAEFYTDSSKMHSVTFPVCGYRDWNGKAEVVDFKVRGFVWLRGLQNNPEAYMFRYAAHASGAANVAPVTMFYATDGLPVRPALQQ